MHVSNYILVSLQQSYKLTKTSAFHEYKGIGYNTEVLNS